MLAEGDLDSVEEFDDQQDEQNLIQQGDDVVPQRAVEHALPKADSTGDEKNQRTASEQQAEPEVHDILKPGEPLSYPRALGRWVRSRNSRTAVTATISKAGSERFIGLSSIGTTADTVVVMSGAGPQPIDLP